MDSTSAALDPRGAWPAWVLSNHDQKRHRTRYGSEERARVAALLLLTLRGTAFLYMGEELGLEDATVPPERQLDPGGRDGCRAPIPWKQAAPHGWGGAPWLPWPPDAAQRSVEQQQGQEGSMLHLYRRLLALRRESPALRQGDLERLPLSGDLLAYWRQEGPDRRLIVLNFAGAPAHFECSERLHVVLSSDGRGEGEPFDGRVAPDQALLLQPY